MERRAYFPFITGPKLCVGSHFALMEAAMALDRFAWREATEEDARVIASVQARRRSPAAQAGFYAPYWDRPHYEFTKQLVGDLVGSAPNGQRTRPGLFARLIDTGPARTRWLGFESACQRLSNRVRCSTRPSSKRWCTSGSSQYQQ